MGSCFPFFGPAARPPKNSFCRPSRLPPPASPQPPRFRPAPKRPQARPGSAPPSRAFGLEEGDDLPRGAVAGAAEPGLRGPGAPHLVEHLPGSGGGGGPGGRVRGWLKAVGVVGPPVFFLKVGGSARLLLFVCFKGWSKSSGLGFGWVWDGFGMGGSSWCTCSS